MVARIILFLLLLTTIASAQFVAVDPTRQVPNARVLGLGKAFIALADDTAAMFTNPAGLARASAWQLTSMSGKFLEDYSFLSMGGLYPTNWGVVGIGFAGTSIAGAFATTIEAGSEGNPIYTIDTSQPEMGNYNNAFVISYARDWNELLSYGLNLKIFSTSLYGDGITGGNAAGKELDFGLKLYPPAKWMNLGLCVQNLLPSSLGGKLTYSSGHEESYPAVVEVGSAFRILGEKDALRKFRGQELLYLLDFDYYPTLSNYPIVFHSGIEWKPASVLAIRLGIDQDSAGDGAGGLTVVSDYTAGVGFLYQGFRFDYAYHTFVGAPGIGNHYFSFTYGILPPKVEKPMVKPKTLQLLSFPDVPSNYWAREPIGYLATLGLVSGYPDGTFKPEGNITRAEMAALLMKTRRTRDEGRGTKIFFNDVSEKHWATAYITQASELGIVKGYPDETFKPNGLVTRAEGLAMITRRFGITEEVYANQFNDIVSSHWSAKIISGAYKAGVLKYLEGKPFDPNRPLTRAEAVEMLYRTNYVQDLVLKMKEGG